MMSTAVFLMVLDSSAVLALLLKEPEATRAAEMISSARKRLISTVSLLECDIVISAKKGPAGSRELDLLVHRGEIQSVAFDSAQANLAREAYARFGKGRHRAALNFGDCCAYALARHASQPLLFKGRDFSETDLLLLPL